MWPNPQFPADLVTFTGQILNGKLHFLCIVKHNNEGLKYFIGYQEGEIVKSLCIILPQVGI